MQVNFWNLRTHKRISAYVRVCTQTLCKSRSLAASESGSRQKQEQTTVTGIYDSVRIAAPILTEHST